MINQAIDSNADKWIIFYNVEVSVLPWMIRKRVWCVQGEGATVICTTQNTDLYNLAQGPEESVAEYTSRLKIQ
jgi:hypothetical protein